MKRKLYLWISHDIIIGFAVLTGDIEKKIDIIQTLLENKR